MEILSYVDAKSCAHKFQHLNSKVIRSRSPVDLPVANQH